MHESRFDDIFIEIRNLLIIWGFRKRFLKIIAVALSEKQESEQWLKFVELQLTTSNHQ